MAITKLNEGHLLPGYGFPHLHAVLASTDNYQIDVGTRAWAKNLDCDSLMEVVWGKAGEDLTIGALCVFAEDFVATEVDPNNIGQCGVAIGDGTSADTVASGSYCWFAIWGQVRILAADTAATKAIYIDDAVAGAIDDAVVSGDRVYGATCVEADVTTSGAYNETTAKCMISYPEVADV